MYMDYWPSILAITSFQIVGLISPGPDFTVVVRNSLIYSRKAGILTAIGVALGIFVHLSYILLGLGILIAKTEWIFLLIKCLGCSYLIYIGSKGLLARKQALEYKAPHQQKEISTVVALRSGFLTNVLNAKCMLFFLSILTAFLKPNIPTVIIFIYGAIIFLTTLVWFFLVALCFSNKRLRHNFSNMHHWIERVTGGLLILLGIRMFFAEASSY